MSSSPRPLVSVLVRTKDRPVLLHDALESLRRQTRTDFEVVLVNDGGAPPPLFEPAPGLGITLVSTEPPHGRAKALNVAYRASRGRYVAYLDDDDVYRPEHIETLVDALAAPHATGVAYVDVEQIEQTLGDDGRYRDGRPITIYGRSFDAARLLYRNSIPLIALMHERALGEDAGLFDEAFDLYEDWDFLVRLSRRATFVHVPKITAVYRLRNDGTNASTASPWRGARSQEARRQLFSKYAALRTPDAEIAFLDGVEEEEWTLRRDAGRLRFDLEARDRMLEETTDRVDLLKARVSDLDQEIVQLTGALQSGAERESLLLAERAELGRENERLRGVIHAVEHSLAWRVLRPYRRLKAWLSS